MSLFELPSVEGAARPPRRGEPRWLVHELARINIAGSPAPQGSKTAIRRPPYLIEGTSASGRALHAHWREAVAAEARRWVEAGGTPTGEPVAVELTFRLPRLASMPVRSYKFQTTRPDVDKLTRAVLDALTGLLWRNDAQVCQLAAMKRYADPDEATGCAIVVGTVSVA